MLARAPGAARSEFTTSRGKCRAASARTARWRGRAKAGKIVVAIEVDAAVVDMLVRMQWLAAADAENRSAVGDAIARMLRDSARV
jgi:hypothetical protein